MTTVKVPGELFAIDGFGGRLPWGTSPCLLLVDFQRAFFDDKNKFYLGSESCLEAASRILAVARRSGIPVMHVRVGYDKDGMSGGLFVKKIAGLRCFAGDNPLAEIMDDVAPNEGEVTFIKQYASSFFGTSLASTLTSLGIDTTIIMGVSTSGGVRATALDAMQYGFVPLVVRQAVGDRNSNAHEASLFDLQMKYAEVVDEHEIILFLEKIFSA